VPRRTGDDRSREVTLYGVRTDPGRWFRTGIVPIDVLKRIGERAERDASRKRKGPASNAPLLYVSGVMGVMFVYQQLRQEYPDAARLFALISVATLTGMLIYRGRRASNTTPFIVLAFLDERRCPSCGYDLTGCDTAEDGCTVCPECGAAWRIGPAQPSATK
jgi:hypothetical protein